MYFPSALQHAILIKRYKRFLADVLLPNQETITIHCANTGAMTGCAGLGDTIWYSTSNDPKRKLPYSWELTYTKQNHWISINTSRANAIVKEAIIQKKIPELLGYSDIKKEVRYGQENSRIDLLLQNDNQHLCYIEIKSVTLYHLETQFGYFPDAVTLRGQKHLRELKSMAKQGKRAILFFLIQHSGIRYFSVAKAIDPAYNMLLKEAIEAGVEVLCYNTTISPEGIWLNNKIKYINQ